MTGDVAADRNDTMAALAAVSAVRYGSRTAASYQREGEWQTVSYDELWRRVGDVALGLVDLGIGVGDRVAILAETRFEFMLADLAISAAGAIVVPVYSSNSADECEWVLSDSGAVAIVCETPAQLTKIESVRGALPDLRTVVLIDGSAPGAITLDELASVGRGVADRSELDRRAAAVGPDDVCLIVYTSGTTGRPKGVALANAGFAAGRHAAVEMQLFEPGDSVYLYLPLAHVFAQLVMAVALEIGGTLSFWGGDPAQIVTELSQVKPTVLPSVPRIFEKVYAAAMGMIPPERADEVATAIEVGVRVREARITGEPVSPEDEAIFERSDTELFPLVRGIFGGNVKLAISGAAPIAPEILRFFYATGVPVMEGWGMSETTGIGTVNLPAAHRFGSIGRPVAGSDIRIAIDGEIEMAGPMLLKEYWRNPEATDEALTPDGYLRTGDLGSIDEDGYVFITGRKKDIIITAGGKNLTPANLEGDLRRSRWISQAVMFADRKPYPVALITLDAEVVIPWATAQGLDPDLASLATNPELIALIQADLDAANANYARVEQIKKFTILGHDFSVESGELTPSLKLKRNVVYANHTDHFESMYD
ncbi:AMP-dependent synthetase/ligase [Desertimonas flava]|uniref:AMP-dependent synthetase/ligase n=1 Tax=Desertimonas flava TaxID=2064846 RepID=UPI000E347ED3|nr:AMP-dependent synthetase/ligase [Desertimonas flava]